MTGAVLPRGAAGRRTGPVTTILSDAVAAAPHADAVSDGTHTLTYAELGSASATAAAGLRAAGVRPGDRVVLRLGNTADAVVMLWGVLRTGAVAVPINPGMRRYHLAHVLADATPVLAVTSPADRRAVADAATAPDFRVSTAAEVLAAGDTPGAPDPDVAADALALLVYTSGSTAAPKGVVCPHGRVDFAARAIAARLGYRGDDVVLTASPLSFDYGLYQVFLAALAHAELALADTASPVALMARLRASRASVVPVVPSLADMLVRLAARGEPPAHVRMFTNTGAALTAPTIAQLRRRFPAAAVVPMYGITECKRVTILEPDGDIRRPGSVGPALPGTRVLILGEDGAELPPGRIGEIVAVGPHVMAGYWRAPELTASRFGVHPATGENLLRTGDYGHLDEAGNLYFAGRRDDQFKRHGTRMSCVEIEAAARDVDGVHAAALVPPSGTRDMVLFVVSDLAVEVVLAEVAERLEPAKVPPVCRVRAALPLTPNGKVDRAALAAEPGNDADEEQ